MATLLDEPARARRGARVLAVDDRSPFREAMCRLVDAADGLELVGAADSGETAVSLAGQLRPDMVLMDVAMPGLGGIEACRAIKSARPSTVVVLVSATHPSELPCEIDESLADAVVWKPNLRPALLQELWATAHADELPNSRTAS